MSIVHRSIKHRRSVRKYLPRVISDNVLQQVLDAARWAPSAHNAQPWRFVVIRDNSIKQKLAEAMASRWNKNMKKDGVSLPERERLISLSVERFAQAPILIVAFLTMEDMEEYPDKERRMIEHTMAVQSVATAIENMLLVAHAEGLGACWFCAPLFCSQTVREVLEAPKSAEPQALITLGYPAEWPELPPRKPIETVVYRNLWGCVK